MHKPRYYECKFCHAIHPWKYNGHCRENAGRFFAEQLDAKHGPHNWELLSMDDRIAADQS